MLKVNKFFALWLMLTLVVEMIILTGILYSTATTFDHTEGQTLLWFLIIMSAFNTLSFFGLKSTIGYVTK